MAWGLSQPAPGQPPGPGREPPTEADLRRRRARSIAIALALGFMVVLFYAVTIAKLGPQVMVRPL